MIIEPDIEELKRRHFEQVSNALNKVGLKMKPPSTEDKLRVAIIELEVANKRLMDALKICQAESEMMWVNVEAMTPEHRHRLARISDAATNALK